MRTLSTLAGLAALGAAPLLAQQPTPPTPPPAPGTPAAPRAPMPPTPPMRIPPGQLRMMRSFGSDSAFQNRPTLGMSLAPTGSARDTLGVFVARVVPGGPAERAGIIEGDRIASIDGVDLRSSASDIDDPYAAALPAHRVTRTVEKLSPGKGVTLRVYSNGRYRNVTVTAGRMGDVYRNRNRMMMFSMDELMGPAMMAIHSVGPTLERIGPMMEQIGPEIEHAMDGVRFEIDDDQPPPPPALRDRHAPPPPPAPPVPAKDHTR